MTIPLHFGCRNCHLESKSILNRTSNTNIGALMLEYGGGRHENAGTCQVSNDMAEDVLGALIERITSEG